MKRIDGIIKRVESAVAGTLLTLITALVFLAALGRWVGMPVAWSIDAAQLMFGWVVFLGADVALKNKSHIGVDMLLLRLPAAVQRVVQLGISIAMAGFLAFITWFGFDLSLGNWERLFNTLQISYSWATLSVPVGCLLMLFTVIHHIIDTLRTQGPRAPENTAAW